MLAQSMKIEREGKQAERKEEKTYKFNVFIYYGKFKAPIFPIGL